MNLSFGELRDRARDPANQKAVRYMLVSVISVVVGLVSNFTLYAGFHWTARSAQIASCAIAGVPSYYLNRTWTWGKKGRSHWLKEVVPFWSLAFLGLVLSTWTADYAESHAVDVTSYRLVQACIINAVIIATFGVLWVVKFVLFNKVMFVKDEDVRAVLADEIVA